MASKRTGKGKAGGGRSKEARPDADSDAPSSGRRRKGSRRDAGTGIWGHALIAVAISGTGLLCAVAILWFQLVDSSNRDYRQGQLDTLAAQYVGFFNSRIGTLERELRSVAQAPGTVAALVSYDDGRMAERGAELTRLLTFARRVVIIPKGQGSTDADAEVPISFAALNLIRRAETQPFVGPEIALSQRGLVYAAASILHDGVNTGVLFAALSSDYFFEPIKSYDAYQGQVRILQSVEGGQPNPVFVFGGAGGNVAPDDVVTLPLASPNWQLEFTPNWEKIGPVAEVSDLLASIGVVAGFILGGIALAFSSLGRKLRSDADQLADYASTLLRGRSGRVERYQLPLFQQLANTLAHFSPRAAAGADDGGPRRPASRTSRAASADADALLVEDEAEAADPVDDLLADDGAAAGRKSSGPGVDSDARENFGIEVSEEVSPLDLGLKLDPNIFRAYDIRGITSQNLTEDVVYWIGRAFAAESLSHNQGRVAIGRDGRHSSAPLAEALTRGLTEGGVDVIDIGQVPTPLLYFATHALDTGTGIMITGSHNPPEYNGLKMMIAGVTLAEDRIQALKTRLEDNELSDGAGDVEQVELDDHYLDRILEDVVVAQPLKVVVDCGNGVAGKLAPRLLSELGCEVVPLYCEVDGDFPNHHPDPAEPQNLDDLITVVKAEGADLGLAFDGDGDRLGVVTRSGDIIWPDKLLMLFAQDVVGRNPGADILYDVKCSRHLNTLISELGGRPIMWKTGHSHMKAKMKETGALLAGEFSGHICFGERWFGFDDALYSAARLLEILGAESKTSDEIFAQFPVTYATPELKIKTSETDKFRIMDKLAESGDFGDGTKTTIDGVRVDYADGWGLIRPSNTSPVLSLRFEADGQDALEKIQQRFEAALAKIDPALKFR